MHLYSPLGTQGCHTLQNGCQGGGRLPPRPLPPYNAALTSGNVHFADTVCIPHRLYTTRFTGSGCEPLDSAWSTDH